MWLITYYEAHHGLHQPIIPQHEVTHLHPTEWTAINRVGPQDLGHTHGPPRNRVLLFAIQVPRSVQAKYGPGLDHPPADLTGPPNSWGAMCMRITDLEHQLAQLEELLEQAESLYGFDRANIKLPEDR